MKHNEQLNKTIDAVLSEHAPLTAKQRVTVRELLLDAIEDAGFDIVGNDTRPTILRPASDDYNKAADAVTWPDDK